MNKIDENFNTTIKEKAAASDESNQIAKEKKFAHIHAMLNKAFLKSKAKSSSSPCNNTMIKSMFNDDQNTGETTQKSVSFVPKDKIFNAIKNRKFSALESLLVAKTIKFRQSLEKKQYNLSPNENRFDEAKMVEKKEKIFKEEEMNDTNISISSNSVGEKISKQSKTSDEFSDLQEDSISLLDHDDDNEIYVFDSPDCSKQLSFKESNTLTEIHHLKTKYQEELLYQRQVSILLRQFYQNSFTDSKKLAKYCNEVINAHKCLLISAEKQFKIQEEIKNLELQNSLIYRMSRKQLMDRKCFKKGCLAIRSISLKLRDARYCASFFNGRNECFVLCLIEHGSNIIETPILNITEKQKDLMSFEINEIFSDLDQNFQLRIKFYFMFHQTASNDTVLKSYFHMFVPGKLRRLLQDNIIRKRRRPLDISEISSIGPISTENNRTSLSATGTGTGTETIIQQQGEQPPPQPVLSSNFTLLGYVKINPTNANKQLLKMEQFNYCSIFEDEVYLDSEISYDYKF